MSRTHTKPPTEPAQLSELYKKILKILPLLPEHRFSQGERKSQMHLDELLDEARLISDIDADSLDYLMMTYRYQQPFKASLKAFRENLKLKPKGIKDLWALAFAAYHSRTQVPFAPLAHVLVELSGEHFSLHSRSISNAYMRFLSRSNGQLMEAYHAAPEKMLPENISSLLDPAEAGRIGRDLIQRQEPGIAAFDCSAAHDTTLLKETFKLYPAASFLRDRDKLCAMNLGSWLFSQWAAEKIATKFPGKKDIRILDACAAPGGKMIAISSLLKSKFPQQKWILGDKSFARMERLKENLSLKRFDASNPIQTQTLLHDFTSPPAGPDFEAGFDVILADLPCSASGTLSTQADLLSVDLQKRLTELGPIQQEILTQLWPLLKAGPDSMLILSLCSVIHSEINDLKSFALSNLKASVSDNYFSFEQSPSTMEGIAAVALKKEKRCHQTFGSNSALLCWR